MFWPPVFKKKSYVSLVYAEIISSQGKGYFPEIIGDIMNKLKYKCKELWFIFICDLSVKTACQRQPD